MVISIICQPDEALEDFERLDSGQVRGGDAFAEGSDTASIHSDTASIASHDVRLDPLQLRLKGKDMHVHVLQLLISDFFICLFFARSPSRQSKSVKYKRHGSVLRHVLLKSISGQILKANVRRP